MEDIYNPLYDLNLLYYTSIEIPMIKTCLSFMLT